MCGDHDCDMTIDSLINQELKGLFEGNDQINSVVHLPDHPTREELVEIKENLEQLFSEDLAKLQNFYNTNIAFVQKRINQMD